MTYLQPILKKRYLKEPKLINLRGMDSRHIKLEERKQKQLRIDMNKELNPYQ